MNNKFVLEQYTNWIYPQPIDDLDQAIKDGYWEIGDPELYWPIFWPYRRDANNLDILVAGCGTNQAAYYAYQNPTWNVLGIDLSEPSLENQRRLKSKHNLKNLRIIKFDITKLSKLGESFDFITSTGVLHHLQSPQEGLIQLRNCLRPNGVMNLMLYGKSLRMGVYILQELFKEAGLKQEKNDVDIIKKTLDSLPDDHIARRYINSTDDLNYDAGIVDTFLHQVDQAYWTKDIFRLVRETGLEFLSWCDPGEYAIENLISKTHPLWGKISGLSDEKTAHLRDLLALDRGTHRFAVAHPAYVAKSKIPFDSDDFFNSYIVPHRSTEVLRPSNGTQYPSALIKRDSFQYEIDHDLANILALCGPLQSLGNVIKSLDVDATSKQKLYTLARDGFKKLASLGHIYILR